MCSFYYESHSADCLHISLHICEGEFYIVLNFHVLFKFCVFYPVSTEIHSYLCQVLSLSFAPRGMYAVGQRAFVVLICQPWSPV